MEEHQANAKSLALGFNDIYKAYDNVNQEKLMSMLQRVPNLPKRNLFMSTLNDYNRCNLQIGSALINRTKGLPQGAKGAPQLFNFYLCQSILKVAKYEYIYADNIVFRESNMAKLTKQENKVLEAIQKNDMTFDNPSTNTVYASTDLPAKLRLDIPVPRKAENTVVPMPTQRVLGYYLKVNDQGMLQFDVAATVKAIQSKIRSLPPYLAMKYFKVYIKPKIMFHFKHLDLLPNTRDIFQSLTCIVCLPYAYLDMNKVFDPGIADPWSKFWSIYVMLKNGNIAMPKDSDHAKIKRWRILCSLMNKYYISIYKAIKFVFTGSIIVRNEPPEERQFKNNAKILDLMWFCIIRKYQVSKTLLIMEKLFLERLIKPRNNKPHLLKKLNLNKMLQIIRKWNK